MSGWRALVCGGRDYVDYERVQQVLDTLLFAEICHGAAKGADALAGRYAAENAIPCQEYPAEWNRQPDGSYDRAAGPKRNQRMLDTFRPDVVIAFPGGRGTAHMVSIARSAGIPVRVVTK